MKTVLLLLTLTLASCAAPVDSDVTFGRALAIGLVRLASEEPKHRSLEETVFGYRQDFDVPACLRPVSR